MGYIILNRSDSSNSVLHPAGPSVGIASTLRNGNNSSESRVKGAMIHPNLLPVEIGRKDGRKIAKEFFLSFPTTPHAKRLFTSNESVNDQRTK